MGSLVAPSPPCREGATKLPISPYGVAKLASEHYLSAYSRLYGLEVASLRYSNVYGPRQNAQGEAGVVAIFARKILAGEPLTIFGDGEQTRGMGGSEERRGGEEGRSRGSPYH